jgi:hypothetical protein
MAADENKTRAFPILPASAWWGLRSRWQSSLPGKVDAQYVETVLGVGEKSAKNIVPQVRTLGLIDEDGKPTPLANEWRTDDGYPDACKQIVETVYPSALRDAVPPDDKLDKDAAGRWFVRERKVGEAAGRQMAALYALIAEANPKGGENQRAPRSDRSAATADRKPRTQGAGGRQTRTTGKVEQQQQPPPPPPPPDNGRSTTPSLHIDVNVHIASDATPEQIDAIFASMSKHLYQQKP